MTFDPRHMVRRLSRKRFPGQPLCVQLTYMVMKTDSYISMPACVASPFISYLYWTEETTPTNYQSM